MGELDKLDDQKKGLERDISDLETLIEDSPVPRRDRDLNSLLATPWGGRVGSSWVDSLGIP